MAEPAEMQPDNPNEEEDWKKRYLDNSEEPPPENAAGTAISLEDTMAVVKEKVWYIGDAALKSVAEVLYGFGISPTILGYSEEELMDEEDEIYEIVQPRIQKDEVVSKTSFAMRSEENMQRRKAEDTSQEEEEAAAAAEEAYLRMQEERALGLVSWTGTGDDLLEEVGEDKKDK